MRPFPIPDAAHTLVQAYPPPELLMNAGSRLRRGEREYLVRLWLTEGIPWAFRQRPIVYEALRYWLAERLKVSAKAITVVGSARLGYSMAKRRYGVAFSEDSDLDLIVIGNTVFDTLSTAFVSWRGDFQRGVIEPRNSTELRYWNDNMELGIRQIERGFITNTLVPNLSRYREAQQVAQLMYVVKEKLTVTPVAPRVSRASLRAYRDWDTCVAQVRLSLDVTLA